MTPDEMEELAERFQYEEVMDYDLNYNKEGHRLREGLPFQVPFPLMRELLDHIEEQDRLLTETRKPTVASMVGYEAGLKEAEAELQLARSVIEAVDEAQHSVDAADHAVLMLRVWNANNTYNSQYGKEKE